MFLTAVVLGSIAGNLLHFMREVVAGVRIKMRRNTKRKRVVGMKPMVEERKDEAKRDKPSNKMIGQTVDDQFPTVAAIAPSKSQ